MRKQNYNTPWTGSKRSYPRIAMKNQEVVSFLNRIKQQHHHVLGYSLWWSAHLLLPRNKDGWRWLVWRTLCSFSATVPFVSILTPYGFISPIQIVLMLMKACTTTIPYQPFEADPLTLYPYFAAFSPSGLHHMLSVACSSSFGAEYTRILHTCESEVRILAWFFES